MAKVQDALKSSRFITKDEFDAPVSLRSKLKEPVAELPQEEVVVKEPQIVPSKEQVKQRAEIKKTAETVKAATPEKPKVIDDSIKSVKSSFAVFPSGEKKQALDVLGRIDQAKKEALADYKQTQDQTRWLSVAETIGQALTQLGAGAYGLKHGVDMSGLKFNKTNWSANLDRAAADLDRKLGLLKEETKAEMAKQQVPKSDMDILKEKKLQAEIDKINRPTKVKSSEKLNLTPGQKKVDEKFGESYEEFVAMGGHADARKQIKQLDGVISGLRKTDSATGGFIGLVPKVMRDIVTPDGAALQDRVEEVVQRNLKNILGAQFTREEGTRLIDRAYNPRLREEENIDRLVSLNNQMKEALESKIRAVEYYEKNGTLKGFKGKLISSQSQFDLEDVPEQKELSSEDKQALQWANSNVDDPRAKEIKKRLGQ